MRITSGNYYQHKPSFGISEGMVESYQSRQLRLNAKKSADQKARLTKIFEQLSNETHCAGDTLVKASTAKNANEAIAKFIKL